MTAKSVKNIYVLFVFCILFLVVELGSYVIWQMIKGEPHFGVFKVNYFAGESERNLTQRIIPKPYGLYWNNPDFEDEFGRVHDSMGYRGPEYRAKSDEVRILVLGGSTTHSWGTIKDWQLTWVHLLGRKIEHAIDRPVHMFNGGLPYGTSAEAMVHYSMNWQYIKPHVVIYHGGGNDITALLYENYARDYSHLRSSAYWDFPNPLRDFLLKNSFTAKLGYAAFFNYGGVYQPTPYPLAQVDRASALQRVIENKSDGFRNNMEVLSALAQAQDALFVSVGFIHAPKDRISLVRKDLAGLEDALLYGEQMHQTILDDVAKKYGGLSVTLDKKEFEANWFVDHCHLTEKGHVEKARQIFAAMRTAIDQL